MLSSYLVALFSGVLLYLVMLLDAKYIEPSDKQISPKLPLFVTLMVWLICVFYKTGATIPVSKQGILVGGFYD